MVAELVHENTRAFVIANSKKGTAPPKALEVPRPPRRHDTTDPSPLTSGETGPARKRPATSEELVAFFGGAARYTGKAKDSSLELGATARARCAAGHYVKDGTPCRRCAGTAEADNPSPTLIP